jgi:hypothetical protein
MSRWPSDFTPEPPAVTPAQRFAIAADTIEGHTLTLANLWDQISADASEDSAELAEEVAAALTAMLAPFEGRIANHTARFASMRPARHVQPPLFDTVAAVQALFLPGGR